MEVHEARAEPWRVTLIDTGDDTQTGGRLKRALPYVSGDEAFCFTYGDGVGNIDIPALLAHHRAECRLATVTATLPPGRFGALRHDGASVTSFQEKPEGDGAWINGGFFVLSPKVGDYIAGQFHIVGGCTDAAPRPRRTAYRAFPPWVLATNGYLARQAASRNPVGLR